LTIYPLGLVSLKDLSSNGGLVHLPYAIASCKSSYKVTIKEDRQRRPVRRRFGGWVNGLTSGAGNMAIPCLRMEGYRCAVERVGCVDYRRPQVVHQSQEMFFLGQRRLQRRNGGHSSTSGAASSNLTTFRIVRANQEAESIIQSERQVIWWLRRSRADRVSCRIRLDPSV
jgi:hypothetical protein